MEPAPSLTADRLNLADRNALSADRQSRRILAGVDAADDALDLGGDGDRLPAGVRGVDGDVVGAVGPRHPVVALAVPGEGLAAGVHGNRTRIGRLARRTG